MPSPAADHRHLVQDLARRHGFGEEAVSRMLDAVVAGHGRMAQFAHPEFGGSGQWMSGGMLMIGDLFDQRLKSRVGALCTDLSAALGSIDPPDTAIGSGAWWPSGLGTPTATGSQGSMRYAHFPDARRLVVDVGGETRVHDTLDHRIGGFSQQQGGSGGLSMSSQHGTIDLATLPVVADAEGEGPAPSDPAAAAAAAKPSDTADTADDDPVRLIERLGRLHEKGVLTDEEFSAKKQELLERL